jgi:hypothetical protein
MSKRPAIVGDIFTLIVWVLVAGGLLWLVLWVIELASPSVSRAVPPFVLGAGIMLGLALLSASVVFGAYLRNRGFPARDRLNAVLVVAVAALVAILTYRAC